MARCLWASAVAAHGAQTLQALEHGAWGSSVSTAPLPPALGLAGWRTQGWQERQCRPTWPGEAPQEPQGPEASGFSSLRPPRRPHAPWEPLTPRCKSPLPTVPAVEPRSDPDEGGERALPASEVVLPPGSWIAPPSPRKPCPSTWSRAGRRPAPHFSSASSTVPGAWSGPPVTCPGLWLACSPLTL